LEPAARIAKFPPPAIFCSGPRSESPKDKAKCNDGHQSQAIADVHGTQKISLLALELQTTIRTSFVHAGKSAEYRGTKNSRGAAARAQLAHDRRERRSLSYLHEGFDSLQLKFASPQQQQSYGRLLRPTVLGRSA